MKCISMNNQECKVRPEIVNVNSDEPIFYPFSIKTSKCSGSCNNINDPYAQMFVPNVVKNLNFNVFNLMSRTNETRLQKGMKHVNASVNLEKMLVIINNFEIKINADVNVKNKLIREYVIKDLFGSLVVVGVNVIKCMMLVNIQIMKIVSAEKIS